MAAIEFLTEFDPAYRQCVEVAPGIRRVVAENPNKFSAWGSGTYLVGRGRVAIIDPGPDLDSHIEAVLRAVDGEEVTHQLITHTHADHSPASAAIGEALGAPTYGFGPHPPGADTGSEEHGDRAFVPDVEVRDGDVISGAGFEFECLHTPGHISNHVCYAERRTRSMFSGDHVMGWSTTVVSPPDGRIDDYLVSLRRMLGRDDLVHYPTHGPPIHDPEQFVRSLIDHRLQRERQILGELGSGPRTIAQLVEELYSDVRPELHEPAGRSVHAHLIALVERGEVRELAEGPYALA